MLNYNELESISKLKRLPLQNAERDYLQEVILFSIYSKLGEELVFKGGTCLYKVYKLDRFSEDLDFTMNKKIEVEKMSDKILADLTLLNIKGKVKEIKEYSNEKTIRLLINGPLYKGGKETQCFIPLNISLREQVLIKPARETISSVYKELPNFEVFAMDKEEILAEKIRAIFTRMKPRDIYDLHFLIAKKDVSFNIELINKKLAIYNLKFNYKELKNKIEKMEGLWKLDLKNLILGELPDFNIIKKEIFEKIR